MKDKVNVSTRIFWFRFGIIIVALLALHVFVTVYRQLGEASQVLNELAQSGMIPTGYKKEGFGKQRGHASLPKFAYRDGSKYITISPTKKQERFFELDLKPKWQNDRNFRTRFQENILTVERRLYETDHAAISKNPLTRSERQERYRNGKDVKKMEIINSMKTIANKNDFKSYTDRRTNNDFHDNNTSNNKTISNDGNNNTKNSSNKINNENTDNNSNRNNNLVNNNNYNKRNNRDNDSSNNHTNSNNKSKNPHKISNNTNQDINNNINNSSNKNISYHNNESSNNNYNSNNNSNNSTKNDNTTKTNEKRFRNKNKGNKSVQENNSKGEKMHKATKRVSRAKVIILAYRRSGSSYVGEMFNRNPRVFYLFEPIHPVEKIAGGGKYPLLYDTLVGNLLDVIYTCSFNKHPFLVNFISRSSFRLKSETLISSGLCALDATPENVSYQCLPLNQTILKRLCRSKDHVVVKSIRASSKKTLEYFDDSRTPHSNSYKVRILHLVRDPRAIISSRLNLYIRRKFKSSTGELKDDKSLTNALRRSVRVGAANLCSRIYSDLKYGRQAGTGVYMLLRYEDAAMHPLEVYHKVSDFSGIKESEEVKHWLKLNTRVADARDDDDEYSTSRNSTASVNGWRRRLPFKLVAEVQGQCSEVMKMLGYLPARSELELMDVKKSLVSLNREERIFKAEPHQQ